MATSDQKTKALSIAVEITKEIARNSQTVSPDKKLEEVYEIVKRLIVDASTDD